MLLIGHRGASHEAPENTLPAFELAWRQGADGIEADFRLTRDGQIVCLHDENTCRTAGTGIAVADSLLEDLRRLDVGKWKGQAWAGTRIPTLPEVLAILPAGNKIYVELKSGQEIINPLAAVLVESKLDPEQLRVLSFDGDLLAKIKRLLPRYKTCLLIDYCWSRKAGGWLPSKKEILSKLQQTGVDGLASRARSVIDRELVAALRIAGKEIHAWTVDDVAEAGRLNELDIDSIMTNRPGWLRSMLSG